MVPTGKPQWPQNMSKGAGLAASPFGKKRNIPWKRRSHWTPDSASSCAPSSRISSSCPAAGRPSRRDLRCRPCQERGGPPPGSPLPTGNSDWSRTRAETQDAYKWLQEYLSEDGFADGLGCVARDLITLYWSFPSFWTSGFSPSSGSSGFSVSSCKSGCTCG